MVKRWELWRKVGKRIPPNTFRFCEVCGKEQEFEYDLSLGHSVCKECGCRNIHLD